MTIFINIIYESGVETAFQFNKSNIMWPNNTILESINASFSEKCEIIVFFNKFMFNTLFL